MTDERKKVTGHILACGTQIMWGATFVSTKVGGFCPRHHIYFNANINADIDTSHF